MIRRFAGDLIGPPAWARHRLHALWRARGWVALLLVLAAPAPAQDLELVSRQDQLHRGRLVTTGEVRNLTDQPIEGLRVYLACYSARGDRVHSTTGRVRARGFWLFPSRRLRPGELGRFEVRVPYRADLRRAVLGFSSQQRAFRFRPDQRAIRF